MQDTDCQAYRKEVKVVWVKFKIFVVLLFIISLFYS